MLGFAQSFGLVGAPVIGGALIDAFTWRACFGINIPIGVVAIVIAALWMKDTYSNPDLELPLHEKLKRLDPFGTILVLPTIVCLLVALLWGGTKYAWKDWRIILLFVLFACLALGFGYIQYRQQDNATVPPRIVKNRTVLASALYLCCVNGLLAVTEYYIAIYFQGVRGFSAAKSGLLGLPMIGGLCVTGIISSICVGWIGYYTRKIFPSRFKNSTTDTDLESVPLCNHHPSTNRFGFTYDLGLGRPNLQGFRAPWIPRCRRRVWYPSTNDCRDDGPAAQGHLSSGGRSCIRFRYWIFALHSNIGNSVPGPIGGRD